MKTESLVIKMAVTEDGQISFRIPPAKLIELSERLEPGVLKFPWQWDEAPDLRFEAAAASLFGYPVWILGKD